MKYQTKIDLWTAAFALGVGLLGAFTGWISVVVCVAAFLIFRWIMGDL